MGTSLPGCVFLRANARVCARVCGLLSVAVSYANKGYTPTRCLCTYQRIHVCVGSGLCRISGRVTVVLPAISPVLGVCLWVCVCVCACVRVSVRVCECACGAFWVVWLFLPARVFVSGSCAPLACVASPMLVPPSLCFVFTCFTTTTTKFSLRPPPPPPERR